MDHVTLVGFASAEVVADLLIFWEWPPFVTQPITDLHTFGEYTPWN